MDGYTDGDYKVVTQMVPTIRYKSVDTCKAAAEQCQPDFILCRSSGGAQILQWNVLLLTAMTSAFRTMEATNLEDEPVVADGPSAYFATLPIKNIVNALHQNGIPAKVSNTAGTFVCNHLMYGVCHYAAQKAILRRALCTFRTSAIPSWWINQINQAWLVETVRATLETIVHVLAHGESYKAQDINYTTPHE